MLPCSESSTSGSYPQPTSQDGYKQGSYYYNYNEHVIDTNHVILLISTLNHMFVMHWTTKAKNVYNYESICTLHVFYMYVYMCMYKIHV